MVIAVAAVVAALQKAGAGRAARLEEGWRRPSSKGPRGRCASTSAAAACVGQPPAWLGQLCELQALAILPAGSGPVASRGIAGLPPRAGGRAVYAGGVGLVFVSNVTGGAPGDGLDFKRQATFMFFGAETALRREGLS